MSAIFGSHRWLLWQQATGHLIELQEGVPMTDVRTGEITRTILIDHRAVDATFWEEAGGRFHVSSPGLPTLLVERNIDAPIEDPCAYSCTCAVRRRRGAWCRRRQQRPGLLGLPQLSEPLGQHAADEPRHGRDGGNRLTGSGLGRNAFHERLTKPLARSGSECEWLCRARQQRLQGIPSDSNPRARSCALLRVARERPIVTDRVMADCSRSG